MASMFFAVHLEHRKYCKSTSTMNLVESTHNSVRWPASCARCEFGWRWTYTLRRAVSCSMSHSEDTDFCWGTTAVSYNQQPLVVRTKGEAGRRSP